MFSVEMLKINRQSVYITKSQQTEFIPPLTSIKKEMWEWFRKSGLVSCTVYKSNIWKVLLANVKNKSSLNKEFLVEVSLNFLCELNKNTLNMSLAKVVLFTLLTQVLDTQVFVHNISK